MTWMQAAMWPWRRLAGRDRRRAVLELIGLLQVSDQLLDVLLVACRVLHEYSRAA
jgi:hypothetical protein